MPRDTVNRYLVSKIGLRRALTVETYVMLWLLFVAAEGEDPRTVEELAAAINRGASTLYRWQSDFREAFPQYSTPRELLDTLDIEHGRVLSARQVGKLQLAP